jgi:guanyl-specific ribonuclease Sa
MSMQIVAPENREQPVKRWFQGILIFLILAIGAYSAWNDGLNDHFSTHDGPHPESPNSPVNNTWSPQSGSDRDVATAPETTRDETESDGELSTESTLADDDTSDRPKYKVERVTLRDQAGRIIYRGSVDLAPTIERIRAGKRLEFSHDGISFENRERLLPGKEPNYYHEFVHPTKGVKGPGPQRIVMGRNGEIYYTADHYRSFLRWDEDAGWVAVKSKVP